MAKAKKTEEVADVDDTTSASTDAVVIDTTNEDITVPIDNVPVVTAFDVVAELHFAQMQIEHCEDYTLVQGADYKGRMRGSLKEWRLYKYKLRQYVIGNVVEPPKRPEIPKDY